MSDIPTVNIIQSVAILIDGNNIERSLHSMTRDENCMINFDNLIPKLLRGRGLSRLIYFREGNQISSKLADRLHDHYMGSVVPCHKSADIPLSISATQIARKVDTIIILSGDSDYVELVRHLKGEGVRIEIAAVKATTAQILIDEADHFLEITQEDSFSLNPKRTVTRKSSTKSSAKRKTTSHNTSSNKSQSTKPTAKKATAKKKESNKVAVKKEVEEAPKAKTSKRRTSTKKTNPKRATAKSKKTESNNQKKDSKQNNSKPKSQTPRKSNKPTRAPKRKVVEIDPSIDDFSY